MKKNFKILFLILVVVMCFSLAGCGKKPVETVPVEEQSTDIVTDDPTQKYMLVDTADYQLKFNILGSWEEYAGSAEIRESSQAMLYVPSHSTDNVYFYVLIDKYQDNSNVSTKDEVIESIKNKYETIEFESINESSENNISKVITIYTIADGINSINSIKNYQYTIIKEGYEISFVYSSPELIYNSQKGYINDMISSAVFTAKQAEDTAETISEEVTDSEENTNDGTENQISNEESQSSEEQTTDIKDTTLAEKVPDEETT